MIANQGVSKEELCVLSSKTKILKNCIEIVERDRNETIRSINFRLNGMEYHIKCVLIVDFK